MNGARGRVKLVLAFVLIVDELICFVKRMGQIMVGFGCGDFGGIGVGTLYRKSNTLAYKSRPNWS